METKVKNKGIDYLLELNARHSEDFVNAALERNLYRAQHPTEIIATKCMDGRLNLPVITETTVGIIQPFRNLGGVFDLGWIGFQMAIKGWVDFSIRHGRHCLVINTYHYSRGDKHRGCRGFQYETDAAIAFTTKLKAQFDKAFGSGVLYTIQCGIETDWDALVFHGENGEVVDLATLSEKDTANGGLKRLLHGLYPHMPEVILNDLLPLVEGNLRHLAKMKALNRPATEIDHNEWVLGVGRGFDWLHEINTAFLVGPFHPNLDEPIKTAATLLLDNVKNGRAKMEDVVLIASAPYRDAIREKSLAELKAQFLANFAYDVIQKHVPELSNIQRLTVTVDMNTRALNVLERR